MVGEWTIGLFGPSTAAPPEEKKLQTSIPIETLRECVAAPPRKKTWLTA